MRAQSRWWCSLRPKLAERILKVLRTAPSDSVNNRFLFALKTIPLVTVRLDGLRLVMPTSARVGERWGIGSLEDFRIKRRIIPVERLREVARGAILRRVR